MPTHLRPGLFEGDWSLAIRQRPSPRQLARCQRFGCLEGGLLGAYRLNARHADAMHQTGRQASRKEEQRAVSCKVHTRTIAHERKRTRESGDELFQVHAKSS